MQRVIDGKRYNTETATLIADNVYWDGHNFERNGTNAWLYRTPKGAFFMVYGTLWQGERDHLEPVSLDEAVSAYECDPNSPYVNLPEHHLEYEEAFGITPEEPEPSPGRPPIYGEKMTQTAIWLPKEMLAWLKEQPGAVSETIRAMVQDRMDS